MNEITDDNAVNIFAVALGKLLKEKEGIVVEIAGEKCIVFNADEQIQIEECDEQSAHLECGQMLWLHDEPCGNA
jgi:hypothetical protein